jgi:glycosyltransferase involved in cell wall biosynthesis
MAIRRRKLLRSFDKITAVSHFVKEKYQYQIDNEITVIYNGIDIDKFNSINSKGDIISNDAVFTFLFPGGIKKNKGGRIAVSTMKKLMETPYPIHLNYAGRTNKKIKTKYPLKNISYVGFLSSEKYLELLKRSNAMILLSKFEAFPLSILEAMALGKPIITTPAGGLTEICKDGINGIYTQRNSEDAAKKIIGLYQQKDLRDTISNNNLKDSQKMDWNNIIPQYLDLYKSLMIKKSD